MALIKWSALGALTTLLDTALNSLASAARVLSAAVVNATNKDRFADFELVVTFGTAPAAGAFVSLYLVPSLDGTNFSDGDAGTAPPISLYVATFPVRAVTTAQRVVARGVLLPPTDFKAILQNDAGQAFAATGNTLKYRTYNEETV